jgi:hypothetical protein
VQGSLDAICTRGPVTLARPACVLCRPACSPPTADCVLVLHNGPPNNGIIHLLATDCVLPVRLAIISLVWVGGGRDSPGGQRCTVMGMRPCHGVSRLAPWCVIACRLCIRWRAGAGVVRGTVRYSTAVAPHDYQSATVLVRVSICVGWVEQG